VSWPEKIKSGGTVHSIVSFADILPTLCESAGINPQKYKADGKSMFSLLTGGTNDIQDEIFIHYSPRWGNFDHTRWVMNDTYKLYRDGNFYNTVLDSMEKNPLMDLSEAEQGIKNVFQQILNENESEIPFELNNKSFNLSY
jgi:arylsulfatase A-like enzyme